MKTVLPSVPGTPTILGSESLTNRRAAGIGRPRPAQPRCVEACEVFALSPVKKARRFRPASSLRLEQKLYFFLRGSARAHPSVLVSLVPVGFSMSVIKFELPKSSKRDVWRCKCGKCRQAAATRGGYRKTPKRAGNVVSLSRWLGEMKSELPQSMA
jgi:hypothetical protein